MFRITTHIGDEQLVLKVEGCLAGQCVGELQTCWQAATFASPGRGMRVDLTDVCHVDEAGRGLLTEMCRAGAHFLTRGCVMPEVMREIAQSAASQRN